MRLIQCSKKSAIIMFPDKKTLPGVRGTTTSTSLKAKIRITPKGAENIPQVI